MHALWLGFVSLWRAGSPSYRADVQSACGDEAVPPEEVEAVIPGHGKSDNGDGEGIVVGEGGEFGGLSRNHFNLFTKPPASQKMAANENMTHSLRSEGSFFLGLNAVLGPVSALAHNL